VEMKQQCWILKHLGRVESEFNCIDVLVDLLQRSMNWLQSFVKKSKMSWVFQASN
jgi:hypothetical protein